MIKNSHIIIGLIGFFLVLNDNALAQSKTQWLKFAEEAVAKNDHFGAVNYYSSALQLDSTDVHLQWSYAESLRKVNNYKKSAYYYHKVYRKERGRLYPMSQFRLAEMQKMSGDYQESLSSWKRVIRKHKRKKKSFEYLKSQQEIKACEYALLNRFDTLEVAINNLTDINSFDTEFGALLDGDSTLYFSALKYGNNSNSYFEPTQKTSQIKIYHTKPDGNWSKNQLIEANINHLGFHNANGSFNKDFTQFYFSRCAEGTCEIYVSEVNGNQFGEAKPIEAINSCSCSSTQPAIAEFEDKIILFFVSNRVEGKGGYDIWYTEQRNGLFTAPVNAGEEINTVGNEITPFFDAQNQVLYFSSDFHLGFGGYDVFKATRVDTGYSTPENLKLPINSPVNDLYFNFYSASNAGFFTSNRHSQHSFKGATCCNDVYTYHYPEEEMVDTTSEKTKARLEQFLPLTLYFHNDEPNPKSLDTTTVLTYDDSYQDYQALQQKYKREYSSGLVEEMKTMAQNKIEDFFVDQVESGRFNLDLFSRILLEELQAGKKIKLIIKGYASPLAKSDYNERLTKRRISSLINQLNQYQNGVFQPFMNDGGLSFEKIPFGESIASKLVSDNLQDQKNSIYSITAALERKIEILSVEVK